MSPEWRERLTRIGLGILCGGSPKEVITLEAKEIASDKLNLPAFTDSKRLHLVAANDFVDTAKGMILSGNSTIALGYIDKASNEIRAVLNEDD